MGTDQILTAASDEDFLGYIPHALGYWPHHSLVFLTLADGRIRATLRTDLPPAHPAGPHGHTPDSGVWRNYARGISACLAADDQAEHTVLAVYSEEPWASEMIGPHRAMVAALADRLHAMSTPLRSAWLVTTSGWWTYVPGTGRCSPASGRPIADIRSSRLSAELVYRGSSYASSVSEAMGMGFGPGVGRSTGISGWHWRYARLLEERWLNQDQFFAVLKLWQTVLSRRRSGGAQQAPEMPADEIAGFLLASLQCRSLRDTLLVHISMGDRTAAGILDCGVLNEADGGVVLPAGCAPAPGSTRTRPLEPGQRDRFSAVLTGQSEDSPDWPALNSAFAFFEELLKLSAGESAAALLTMLAWVEWNRGRGSRAGVLLEHALAAVPGYKLAALLSQLLEAGAMSRWALDAETAWRPDGLQAS